MNRTNILKNILSVAALASCLLMLASCEEFKDEKEFYTKIAKPEQLYEIDVLDLKKMEKPKQDIAKPNIVPEKEIKITLEQCRAWAIENNLELKASLINPAITKESVNAEEAKFEATFNANTSLTKTDTPTSTTLEGSQVESNNSNLGVQFPLRTGGEITFNAADNRTETDNVFSTLNPSYSNTVSVSISQPLLQGAGKRTNTHSIRIANYEYQIVNARTKLEVIRVIASADRLYWRLYAARRDLEVRNKQHQLSQAHLKRARHFVQVGERSQVEIIRAEAGVAQQLEAIIIAENNLRQRQRELKRILNKPDLAMESPTTLIPLTDPDPIHYELAASEVVNMAVDNRMELLELELQIAKDVSNIDYLRNMALPLVNLNYTYNINGLGVSRKDALDVIYDKNFEDHRLGLQLIIPLGNESAKSRLRQAFFQRRQRLATKENRHSLIKVEVLNAIDTLEANWQRILASRQSSILEGRLHEAEMRQFEIGLVTSTDVFEAQTNFTNAQSSEINALAEYQIAMVDLAYATGTLLGAARIEWNPVIPESDL